MKKIYPFLLTISLLTGCEYNYDYSYTVRNKSDSSINVYVRSFRLDTIFTIKKDSTRKLFITNHGIEAGDGPYFRSVYKDLDSMGIMKSDSLISKKDYLKDESWGFNGGDYSATITTDEFK